ncbi:MAG: glycoside hydrolase family 65 protein [Alphaproteobacteria bacterium]|nr:MAG: glycoside hydrolase family 65 protein [Alphaproteobacteria bacterium]PZO32444.1 MAG: glycoside hydrolase family 65 protein [Alphaproteobacteria bacterium]
MKQALEPTADAAWVLNDDGCDPLRESDRATRFAISNGFLGVRASQAINLSPEPLVSPSAYVAGLFDTPDTDRAVPELVPIPNGLRVRIGLPGGQLVQHFGPGPSHPLTLDMQRGLLLSECRLVDGSAVSARLRLLGLVSQDHRSLGLQLLLLEVDQGETEMTLEASFEGVDRDLRAERLESEFGVWRTRHSGKGLGMATSVALQIDSQALLPAALAPFKWSWTWRSRPGQIVCLERIVAVARSDAPDQDPGAVALAHLKVARASGWRSLLADHEAAWSSRWSSSGVEVQGDAAAQKALRFAVYHLNSAANPADPRVSIGARALTGADYRGHVFWDTEIFLLPFYILTWPEAARSLLMYRFHTLEGARAKAADRGWRGAFYAWESTDTGFETTPEQAVGPDRQIIDILTGSQEQHISADVAYAVWQYWQATGDDEFLIEAGAEILLETGRFWSSRAQRETDGFHHIRDVIGPDEYHEGIDDNAFTNVMARWNIRRALEVAALLRARWSEQWAALSSRLDLNDAELQQWSDVAETMWTGLDPGTGLFEQFTGYFDLENVDLAAYAGRSVPMDVVLGRERTQQSQVIKQADVVALLALLPEEFAGDAGVANFRYYEPRCGHGSSLSTAMHGLVAARLGDAEMALDYFRRTAAIDLADTRVAIGGGIHIAAQGGLWMMTVFGFAGLSLRSDGVALAPHLPASWSSLGFSMEWRGRRLTISISQPDHRLEATLQAGDPMTLTVDGRAHRLSLAQPLVADLRGSDPERHVKHQERS